jgi:hypothetical protein
MPACGRLWRMDGSDEPGAIETTPAPAVIPLTLGYAPVRGATLEYATAPVIGTRPPYRSVAVVVVLHLFTFSLSSVFWFNRLHGVLPRTRADDPSPAKAMLLLFVPVVNFYWVFFTWLRLCDRLAEQRQLHGLPPSDTKVLCLIGCILMFVPYLNLLSIFIYQPALFACMQAEVNELYHLGFAPSSARVG